jgi:hypothetical protein
MLFQFYWFLLYCFIISDGASALPATVQSIVFENLGLSDDQERNMLSWFRSLGAGIQENEDGVMLLTVPNIGLVSADRMKAKIRGISGIDASHSTEEAGVVFSHDNSRLVRITIIKE